MARRWAVFLAAVAALLLTTTGTALAGPVTIHDDSKVLDSAKVTDAGNALPDPVQIFTTEQDADNTANFDKKAQSHVNGPTDVVIAVNTKSRHLVIRTGGNSHIGETATAGKAFKDAFGSGDYTGAMVAALNSMTALAGQPAPAQTAPPMTHVNHAAPQQQPNHHSSFNVLGLLCPIIVLGLIVAAVVMFLRRRNRGSGGGFGGGGTPPGGYGPGGYGPGGYGQGGYDQGYGGRRGMSPGMAGGLGAAGGALGGGLLGYELGKLEGEHEESQRHDNYDQGGGYNQGGYDQPSQGFSGGGDYGGGGGDYDFGGGGDSGGGFDGGGSNSDF